MTDACSVLSPFLNEVCFSALLHQLSLEFQESPRNVLLIEVEKQDMRNFLGNAIDCCEALPNDYNYTGVRDYQDSY